MANKKIWIGMLVMMLALNASCSGSDEKPVTFTSIPEFENWLTEQDRNTNANPYSVLLNVSNGDIAYNTATFRGLGNIINNAGRYLNITLGNEITSIGESAFISCIYIVKVVIPSSVTSIGSGAFGGVGSLSSITFQGSIAESNLHPNAFAISVGGGIVGGGIGDIREKYLAGGPGTYTMENRGDMFEPVRVWTKQ